MAVSTTSPRRDPAATPSTGSGAPPGAPAGPGRYLRRLRAIPDPAYGLGPAARVGAGEMVFCAGASFGPRFQTGFEVIAVMRGGLVIEIDGAELRLGPDEVCLLRPGARCLFRFDAAGDSRVRYVVSYEPALPRSLLEGLGGRPFSLPLSTAMSGLLEAVLALSGPAPVGRHVPPSNAAAPIWLAEAAFALFVDEARAGGRIGASVVAPEHPAIAACREAVRRRLSERIGLKDLAAAAGVVPEYLVRLFRARLGTTPMRYLWSARVRLGIHLLEYSDLPVAEVAQRVGCLSPKHFSRLVRAEVGLPPAEVRRRSWSYAGRPATRWLFDGERRLRPPTPAKSA
jgi:AraC-like DNA-binding protein